MSRQRIAYKRWDPVPHGFIGRKVNKTKIDPGLIDKLTSLAEVKLYLKLAVLCVYDGGVEIANTDLMTLAGLSETSFFRARAALEKTYQVIEREVTDKRSKTYRYRVREYIDIGSERTQDEEEVAPTLVLGAEWIPEKVLHGALNPTPTLLSRDPRAARANADTQPVQQPKVDASTLPRVAKRPAVPFPTKPDPSAMPVVAPVIDISTLPRIRHRRLRA